MRKHDVIMDEKRGFQGIWISKELYYDNDLNWNERIILAEIESLNKIGDCIAYNKHFANMLGISLRSVERLMTDLRKKGYINSELKHDKSTGQVSKRILSVNLPPIPPTQKSGDTDLNVGQDTDLKGGIEEYNVRITTKENNNLVNKENIPAPECPCDYEKVELNQPDIEDTKSQWHWKNEKMYNDYLSKVLINYLWNIAKRNRSDNQSRQVYVNFWEKLIKKYFKYYRINTGKWHPWYKEELLEKNIKSFYDFGLNEEREEHTVDSECFEEYTKRFFSHNSFSDYTLSVFSSERVLTGLYGEIAEEYSVFEELKEEFV